MLKAVKSFFKDRDNHALFGPLAVIGVLVWAHAPWVFLLILALSFVLGALLAWALRDSITALPLLLLACCGFGLWTALALGYELGLGRPIPEDEAGAVLCLTCAFAYRLWLDMPFSDDSDRRLLG